MRSLPITEAGCGNLGALAEGERHRGGHFVGEWGGLGSPAQGDYSVTLRVQAVHHGTR